MLKTTVVTGTKKPLRKQGFYCIIIYVMRPEFTYDIIETITDSAKSAVFLASCEGYDEPVIVKVLRRGDLRIVERIAGISSVHIPKVLHYEQAEESGEITVIEEYISGETIGEYVRKHNLTENAIVRLIRQVGEALTLLHSQEPPIIHRDLKPSNLIVSEDGVVKLIDFDASREYKSDRTNDTRALGTTGYAPPEQFGYSQTDVRSDIYSLGVVLKELLGESVSPRMKGVIERSTMFDPEARYGSVEDMMAALQGGARRRPVLPFIAAGVAIVATVVLGIFLWRMNSKDTESSDTGEVQEVTISTMDWKTDSQIPATYYYWTEHPELTPVIVTATAVHGLTAKQVQISSSESVYTDNLEETSWHQDEHGFIRLEPEFLSGLKKDVVYTLVADFGSLRISFRVCSVDDLDSVVNGVPSLAPGYAEYLRTEPGDIYTCVTNPFGRKLLRLEDTETGEELDSSFYDYDEESQTVRFHQDLFEPVPDGEYRNYFTIFESRPELEDPPAGKGPSITFCVRDHAYVRPEFERTSFIMSSNELQDMDVRIVWNDGEGKLESIMLTEGLGDEKPVLDENQYAVEKDGIIIKKEYLETLPPGEYEFIFEFGDVGQRVHLIIH